MSQAAVFVNKALLEHQPRFHCLRFSQCYNGRVTQKLYDHKTYLLAEEVL